MSTNTQLFRNDTTATATGLRRVGRVDRDNLDSGLNSLVVEPFTEHPQTHVVSGAGKVAVLEHEINLPLLLPTSRTILGYHILAVAPRREGQA